MKQDKDVTVEKLKEKGRHVSSEAEATATGYRHEVVVKDLAPGKTYVYICGSEASGLSPMNVFTAPEDPAEPRFAIFGPLFNSMESQKTLIDLSTQWSIDEYDLVMTFGEPRYTPGNDLLDSV
jgi:hypothetical protein